MKFEETRPEDLIARTQNWWATYRHVKVVDNALSIAFAEHFSRAIGHQLARNSVAGVYPRTFREIADIINLHPANLYRSRSGQSKPTLDTLLAIGTAIGMPLTSLIPVESQWISHAIRHLCKGEVSEADALIHTLYSLKRKNNYHYIANVTNLADFAGEVDGLNDPREIFNAIARVSLAILRQIPDAAAQIASL